MTKLQINGEARNADVPADMPLLWVLRDSLGLTGTKFGCGVGQCGACTVHIEGEAVRSWGTRASAVAGQKGTLSAHRPRHQARQRRGWQMSQGTQSTKINRRGFLQATAAAGAGLVL